MPKRKATAIEANNENERVSTLKTPGGPAIYAANDKIARKVLHSRPKPPAKRQRQSAKGDKPLRKAKASKAQKEAEVNTLATTSAPLATAASLPPEIWRLIGEMIPYPQTLRSLVLVSRAFREIFTPLLYTRRIINLEYFTKPLNETPLPPYLEYCQEFLVNLYEFRGSGTEYDRKKNGDFAAWLGKALESTRRLRLFSWRDESFEDTYDPALILLHYDLLHTLKGIQSLRHISIHFAPYLIEDSVEIANCYVPLKGFRNLTSLELYDFYKEYQGIIKDIGTVLCESPFLKKLAVGCAVDCHHHDEATLYQRTGLGVDFFERLCEFYGSASRTGPLSLQTLRLGHGIFLHDPEWPTYDDMCSPKSHPLPKLLDVKSLEVLHICNGLVMEDSDLPDSFNPITNWGLFVPEGETKILRQLAVSRLTEDVTIWLRHGRVQVQELIVTDHYHFKDTDLGEFYRLPSGLSMIWTRDMHPWEGSRSRDHDSDSDSDSDSDEWSDIDSDDDAELDSILHLGMGLVDYPLDRPPPSPKLSLPTKFKTVLDRLPGGGSSLTQLSLSLDFEKQWTHFSTHLPHLTRLTHLRIAPKSGRGGNYPTRASSLWPDITGTVDIAARYAIITAAICPSLRFIRIGDFAWEISYPSVPNALNPLSTSSVASRTRSKTQAAASRAQTGPLTWKETGIILTRLGDEEVAAMLEAGGKGEMFGWMDFAECAGLLGPARNRAERREGGEGPSLELVNQALLERGYSPLPL